MPGSMIHLAVAHTYKPDGDGLFYFGNIAPDYIDIRSIKDIIHLRDRREGRMDALRELRGELDANNSFELGWILHLFADYYWDNEIFASYMSRHIAEPDWFSSYRAELGRLSYQMYRVVPWASEIWARMEGCQLGESRRLTSILPVPLELAWYRERVRARHERGGDTPTELTVNSAERFAAETAERFAAFMNE